LWLYVRYPLSFGLCTVENHSCSCHSVQDDFVYLHVSWRVETFNSCMCFWCPMCY
jgi:hypothetical protein